METLVKIKSKAFLLSIDLKRLYSHTAPRNLTAGHCPPKRGQIFSLATACLPSGLGLIRLKLL